MRDIIENQFRDHRPDVSVTYETVAGGPSGVEQRILLSIAAGASVDTALTHTRFLRSLIAQDLLVDLRPFIERDGLDISQFPKGVIDSYTGPNGEIYALPFQWTTLVLGYNKNYFQQLGMEYPTNDWTIFDMEDAARRLTQDVDGDGRNDRFGLGLTLLEEYVTRLWGVPFATEDLSRSAWHDPRAVEAWEWYAELYEAQRHRGGILGSDPHWIEGNMAMWLTWPVLRLIQHAPFMSDSWDVAMHPYGANGDRVARAAGAQWVILKSSPNHEEAWQLLKYLASEEVQFELIARGLGGVNMESMRRYWITDFNPARSGINDPNTLQNRQVIIDAYAYASLDRTPVEYNRLLDQIVLPMAQRLRNGEVPAASAVAEAAASIDAILAERRR